jgi:hypothetical protein
MAALHVFGDNLVYVQVSQYHSGKVLQGFVTVGVIYIYIYIYIYIAILFTSLTGCSQTPNVTKKPEGVPQFCNLFL